MMKSFGIALALVTWLLTSPAAAESPAASQPPLALSNASPSKDDLIRRFLAAIAERDTGALDSLRMTQREYCEIIAPGTVAPGQPPRATEARILDFYWRMLDTKSRDQSRQVLEAYGGKKFEVVGIEYVRGDKEYAWYRAIGEPRIRVRNEAGKEAVIPAGYVAEVGGQYKFIGLNWED